MEMKSYLKSTRERSTVLDCIHWCKRKTLHLGGLSNLIFRCSGYFIINGSRIKKVISSYNLIILPAKSIMN